MAGIFSLIYVVQNQPTNREKNIDWRGMSCQTCTVVHVHVCVTVYHIMIFSELTFSKCSLKCQWSPCRSLIAKTPSEIESLVLCIPCILSSDIASYNKSLDLVFFFADFSCVEVSECFKVRQKKRPIKSFVTKIFCRIH